MKKLHYEDIEVGSSDRFGSYPVTREEIIEFASKWDPQPFHLDDEAAKDSIFGSLTACAAHIFSIQSWLANRNPKPVAILAGLGMEELRLVAPVRPDDVLSLETTVVDKRVSRSKPDRGIVTKRNVVVNQRDEVVMTQTGKILVSLRAATDS